MRPIATDVAACSVGCVSVYLPDCVLAAGKLCKNGWTDQDAVFLGGEGWSDSYGSKEPRVRWGSTGEGALSRGTFAGPL